MTAPEIMREIEIDLEDVQRLIERSAKMLPHDDVERLHQFLLAVTTIVQLVRERGTTIHRLRRLFGLAKSEKTADVLARKDRSSASGRDDDPAAEHSELEPESSETSAPHGRTSNVAQSSSNGEAHGHKASEIEKKKGHGRIPSSAYVNATLNFVPHEDLVPGTTCPSGCGGKVREQREPSVTIRIKGRAPLEAESWACQRLRCDTCGEIYTAAEPQEARGDKYDATAASMIAILHYGSGMPFHRLDRLQRELGAPVPASTQWEVMRDRADILRPAYEELLNQAASGSILHTDDTYACILALKGKRREQLVSDEELEDPERTGLFTTGLVSKLDDKRTISLFFTGRRHAGENLAKVLDYRPLALATPIHMSDGLSRNKPKGHDVLSAECLAHGRRGIVDQVDNFPEECESLLEMFSEVFKMDELARTQNLSAGERLRLHRKSSGPVLGKIKKSINRLLRGHDVEGNSDFGGALLYLRKHWKKLTLFLRAPGAPLTNNLCERILKMAIMYRKNCYFYRSERGAGVGDIYMSLIHTAALCGENPFNYLTALLQHEADVAARPSDWLPWNYRTTLGHMSHRLELAA